MILAILAGRKTQTRRIVKPQPVQGTSVCMFADDWQWRRKGGIHSTISNKPSGPEDIANDCPYGVAGDLLWVRENFWQAVGSTQSASGEYESYWKHGIVEYDDQRTKAGWHNNDQYGKGWMARRPSIHMPRWASRIMLEVTGVRVERLEDTSDEDCVAEGCAGGNGSIPNYGFSATPQEHYRHVWESINGKGSWNVNPWVWVIEFKRLEVK